MQKNVKRFMVVLINRLEANALLSFVKKITGSIARADCSFLCRNPYFFKKQALLARVFAQ